MIEGRKTLLELSVLDITNDLVRAVGEFVEEDVGIKGSESLRDACKRTRSIGWQGILNHIKHHVFLTYHVPEEDMRYLEDESRSVSLLEAARRIRAYMHAHPQANRGVVA